jgi:hypothetical protein
LIRTILQFWLDPSKPAINMEDNLDRGRYPKRQAYATSMLEHLLSFVTVISVGVAATATYISVRNSARQLSAQIFLAYSNRVREIRQSAALTSIDLEQTLNATFLIFELYELRRRGYVSSAIWSIWDRDVSDLMRTENFRTQWKIVSVKLRNHAHFVQWVNAQLANMAPGGMESGQAGTKIDSDPR